MQTVLLVIHVILAVSMIGIILIQRSEGGGLGMGRSDASLMTARGQANLLTRTTAILATLFFITSLALFILSVHGRAPQSIINTPATPPAPTAPSAPGAPPAPPAGTPAPAPAAPAAAPAAPAPAAPAAPTAPTK